MYVLVFKKLIKYIRLRELARERFRDKQFLPV